MGLAGTSGPVQCPLPRRRNGLPGRRQFGTDVQHHLDVRAQQLLADHRALGGEALPGPVVRRTEGHAVVVDRAGQRHHLVATGIGEEMAVPAGEAVQAAHGRHHLGARSQHQVVSVGQHDLDAQVVEVLGR